MLLLLLRYRLRWLIIEYLSLLLLEVLPLTVLLLVSIIEVNVSLHDGSEVLNRFLSADGDKLLKASLGVL